MIPGKRSPKSARLVFAALFSSLLLILAFPGPDLGWLACLALVPLLSAVVRLDAKRSFLTGWLCGAVWFAVSLNWLTQTLRLYAGIPFVISQFLIVLLGGVLGLYLGAFTAVVRMLSRQAGVLWYLTVPSAWVLLEFTRSWIPAPFPWLLLGNSLWKYQSVSSLYGITGVYGVSFTIVLVNLLVWRTVAEIRSPGGVKRGMARLMVFALLAAAVLMAGFAEDSPGGNSGVKVGVIQGNYAQELKWEESLEEEILETYLTLSNRAADSGASIIVWPETSVSSYFQSDAQMAERLRAFTRQREVHLIFGNPAFEVRDGKFVLFNRAYHLSPDGGTESYDKVRLVPFGEYIPFHPILSFVERLVPGEGQFVPGGPPRPFALPVPMGPLICFEVSMPDLARNLVRKGAGILVNLINDAWFGTTWGPYQHLAMAAVRAAEHRTPVLRAANTGISAVIDGRGYLEKTVELFERGFIVTNVVPANGGSIYSRAGDWIVYLSGIMIIFQGLKTLFAGRSRA